LVDRAAFGRRGRWGDIFRQRIGPTFDGRLIVEIGCFDAAYLSRIAAKYPGTAFVGLDWKCKAVYDGARRITDLGLRNVLLVRGRGQDVLRIFAEREVDEVWVFHPDPCDRPAELKNRLMAEPFLTDVYAVLREAGSRLSLKTDHPGYYQWVLGLFDLPEPQGFRPRARTRDLMPATDLRDRSEAILRRFRVLVNSADYWNDPAARAATADRYFAGEATLFESRFVTKRQPIYYFEIGKR
jgi:tRNA G46 methylase TrmB